MTHRLADLPSLYRRKHAENPEDLRVQERPYQDNAAPATNGVAIANLVRLAPLTDNLTYLDRVLASPGDRPHPAHGSPRPGLPRHRLSRTGGLPSYPTIKVTD